MLFLFTLLVILIACIFLFPGKVFAIAALELDLWFHHMIPALFPFMLLSSIIIQMHFTERIVAWLYPFIKKLFHTNYAGSYTIISGFLCGFPMGAKVIREFTEQKALSVNHAKQLLLFCNNIGPIYFLTCVSPYLHHINRIFALTVLYAIPFTDGILICKNNKTPSAKHETDMSDSPGCSEDFFTILDQIIHTNINQITQLGGYMILFGLLNILTTLLPEQIQHITCNLFEINYGRIQLTQTAHTPMQEILFLSALPFGGLCCFAQTKYMLSNTSIHSLKDYTFHKLLQSLVCFCFFTIYYTLLIS